MSRAFIFENEFGFTKSNEPEFIWWDLWIRMASWFYKSIFFDIDSGILGKKSESRLLPITSWDAVPLSFWKLVGGGLFD